jgi:hypothetical protein
MPILAPVFLAESVSAARVVEQNMARNLGALAASQPLVADQLAEAALGKQWVFARDGSLTAMEADGRWWADCSVPLLVGRALLKTLQAGHTGSCLLAPGNAGLVVAARERIGRCTPLFVAQPDLEIGRMILACHDFSDEIRRHRLWLVCGPQWAEQLRDIFGRHPGLATPVQFIRTKLSPETLIGPMVADAQAVFSDVISGRSQQIERMRSDPRGEKDVRNILLIGGCEFRLWDDGATALHEQLSTALAGSGSIKRFDTDEPLASSPIALLEAAAARGSVVSANLCRPDCNNLISLEIPWITWMTRAGAPPFETAGPRDGLILADAAWRDIARRAGWPDDRVRIAPPCAGKVQSAKCRVQTEEGRSTLVFPAPHSALCTHTSAVTLGLLDNTRKIEIPASVKQFSSHRLLWDLIEEEISASPFAVENIDDYLTNRSGQLNIAHDALDRRAFNEQLILPAYAQGLARILLAARLPLALWGEGWGELEEFAAAARGPLTDRHAFHEAIARSTSLVYCWPQRTAHSIDFAGKPVVHRTGNDAALFIRDAQRALAGKTHAASNEDQTLGRVIVEMLTQNK